MLGKADSMAAITATKANTETIVAFQTPILRAQNLRSCVASTITAIEMAIIKKYRPVRYPIVSGSPMDGGLGGYFRPGANTRATNAASANQADKVRTLRLPARP